MIAPMSVESNNATTPSPAVAPGSEDIDPRRTAEDLGKVGIDPRLPAFVPGFDAPFFQAGLAGYSDGAMRIIARRHGCPYCVTEALLDRTLLAGGRGFAKADLGDLHDNVPGGEEDHPLAGQIMGSEPAEMAAGALKMVEQGTRHDREYRSMAYAANGSFAPTTQHLRLPGGEQLGRVDLCEDANDEWGSCDPVDHQAHTPGSPLLRALRVSARNSSSDSSPAHPPASPSSTLPLTASPSHSFSSIDINLACPVKKIASKARGGHWLAEPDGAIRILEAVREAVPNHIHCTVKLRRAFDDTPEMASNCDRILAAAFDMGYAWATVHARTVEQKYIGPSRWDVLRDIVARHPDRIIFGSGDVWSAPDIFRMIAYTGVKAVAVARGCIGNPWIFRQARDLMAGREPAPPTIAEQAAVLREHFALLLAVNHGARHCETTSSRQIRKFGIRFASHHPRNKQVRLAMIGVESREDWEQVLADHYTGEPA
ncbi:putative tRNA-dihydrouridine synthase [Phycisphaerales bacterium]|nr:putative tRNA-dihydrouridine synthase [Phycisphaerales bacterium]